MGQAGIRMGWKLQILHVFWKKLRTLFTSESQHRHLVLPLKMTLVLNFKWKEEIGIEQLKKVL